MTTVIASLLVPVLYLWVLWALYVMIVGIYRAHLAGRLGRVAGLMALPWIVLGYAMDALANLVLASAAFLDPPRELLVTTRMQRYLAGPTGWRRTLATWVCAHLLDVFDPTGRHC